MTTPRKSTRPLTREKMTRGEFVAASLVAGMVKAMKSTRPQAKTAARKAFEFYWGPNPVECAWVIWRDCWRTARGGKPRKREKEV